jgi:acetylornithine deacetylase/succinyl-diaminopimelate desuccinylase-like protein
MVNLSTPLQELHKQWNDIKEKALQEFFTFLRFESVSTDPQYKPKVLACADWLSQYIKNIGFEVEIWKTEGYPVIYASYLGAGPDKPTLLIYNHYDVQPIDPVAEWESPPFEPTVRQGEIYARGAQDNKGQCFYVLQALKGMMKKHKRLPINIKLCIEGEEESGSKSLSKLLKDQEYQKKLKADYLAIVDMGIPHKDTPAVTLGVRGLVTMEVRVQGSLTDLHSGSHGGIVHNPLHALVQMLSSLRDAEGRVTIPGFYQDVKEMSPEQKKQVSLEFDEQEYRKMFEASPSGGEKQFSHLERAWIRPTLEINGITGGYGGPGFKTVIPAKAMAKVSCRLVPNQDPQRMGALVANHLKSIAPAGIHVEVEVYPGMGKAIRANPNSTVVSAFSKAYEELYQKPCRNIYDGGSIPIVTQLAEASHTEVILLGFGLPDDQIHAPNEHFGIDRLEKGFLVVSRAIELLS